MSGSDFEIAAPTSEEEIVKRKKKSRTAKSFLTAVPKRFGCSLFYIVGFHLNQWLNSFHVAVDVEFAPEFSGNEDDPTGVETNGQLKWESHRYYQQPSRMSPRLSTVECEAGSCWSSRLTMVLYVFKLGFCYCCSLLITIFFNDIFAFSIYSSPILLLLPFLPLGANLCHYAVQCILRRRNHS